MSPSTGRWEAKKAFLFDLDGTLVDSSPLHEAAFRAALGKGAGAAFQYEHWKGMTTREVFLGLGYDVDQALELTRVKQALYRQGVMAGETRLLPGALELLTSLCACGRTCYIVTSGSRDSVGAVLHATGLDSLVSGVVTGADVARGKPDPEPYRTCLERFGVPVGLAVAVEDAESGVQSAAAAGLDVVLVNNPLLHWEPAFTSLRALHEFLVDRRVLD